MKKDTLRFAFFGNSYQPKKSQAISKITCYLRQQGAEIYIDRPFYDFLCEQKMQVECDGVFDGADFTAHFAVSMGGDGTLLKTAARVGEKQIPIVGVNMGRLGFLAEVQPSDVEQAFSALLNGTYTIHPHTVLKIETDDDSEVNADPYALNDISILKRDHASMISIHTSIDREYLMTYQADGLIVATPTGSTAYNLSNGGPIIAPGTDTLCLTAVAPHSLSARPIIVPDKSVLTMKVASRSHSFLIAIDGRSYKLHDGTVLTISKAPYDARIVRIGEKHYFSTLRDKMMWGLDQR